MRNSCRVGAKTWMLVYADGSARASLQRRTTLDREATVAFVGTLFPDEKLPPRFIGARRGTLHAMHSVVDWFAYAQWVDGRLVRSLSLSPDSGVLEDIGTRLPFEEPYWSGRQPAVDGDENADYPFPFHPLDLGEAALAALFGYNIEGRIDPALLAPESVPLARYMRSRSRWKFG